MVMLSNLAEMYTMNSYHTTNISRHINMSISIIYQYFNVDVIYGY